MKLLNQMPVLDDGSVAIYNASLSQNDILDLRRDMMRGYSNDHILRFCSIMMLIRCPLFVQLYISTNLLNHTMISKKNAALTAWKPDVSYIKAPSLEMSQEIASDIENTINALLMNPTAYNMDGCDNFVSQVTTPISVYNDLMVQASLLDWIRFCDKSGLPSPIEQYRTTIVAFLKAEYPHCKEVQDLNGS